MLEPVAQIRDAIALFFKTFTRVGSASQTVKVFRNEGLAFPSRLRNGDTTVFRPLTASAALRTLNNPRYAGAYVYGRRRYRRGADGKKTIQKERAQRDWLACIPNAHPGYISWEQFQENLRILETNGRPYELARASPPREGRRCCRDAPYAAGAEITSASDTSRGAESRKPGMCATVGMPLVANPTASPSRDFPSTKPLEHS